MPSKDVRIDLLTARHRRAVLRGEKASVRRIARLYRAIEDAILTDLRAVEGTIRDLSAQGEEIPAYMLRRYGDLGAMIGRTEARLGQFAEVLAGDVLAQKERSARLGARQAGELLKIEVGTSLRGLNEAAILQIAGSTAPGSPLRTLINEIPGAAIRSFERILVSGIALGQNPATIARRLRRDIGPNDVDGSPRALTVARALRITRNESIRALTAAQSATYAENSDVVTGMRIVEACDARTCALCWARHGLIVAVGATMARHVCCRASWAPVTRYSKTREKGPEKFAKLSKAEQLHILKRGRYDLYERGMPLESIYRESSHPLWGPQLESVSIEDLTRLAL